MAEIVSVRIGEELEKDILKVEKKLLVDRSEIIRRLLTAAIKEWKLQNALEELTAHKISLGKAAEIANVSIWEMIEITKKKNTDWLGIKTEDIEQDLEIIKKLTKK